MVVANYSLTAVAAALGCYGARILRRGRHTGAGA